MSFILLNMQDVYYQNTKLHTSNKIKIKFIHI